jgi:hypothetical protein
MRRRSEMSSTWDWDRADPYDPLVDDAADDNLRTKIEALRAQQMAFTKAPDEFVAIGAAGAVVVLDIVLDLLDEES